MSTLQILKAGSTNSLGVCDEALFDDLVVARRYCGIRVFFVSDPAGVKHVLLDRFDDYPRLSSIRRLFEVELRTGTLASEGETWRRHRRVATPTLDPRAVQPDVPALLAVAERAAAALERHAETKPVDMERWISRLSLQLWNQTVTGGRPDTLPMLAWLSKIPRKPQLLDLVPKPRWMAALLPDGRRREAAPLDAQLRGLIAERLDEGYAGPRDLIWRLAHQRDRKTGDRLPPSEVRDEAASLIAGGAATVRTLTWIWYLLALDPDVEARLHGELDAVLQNRKPTPGHLPALAYMRQVLDETMRLYPPIPAILREAAADDAICGHAVPRGAIVAVMPWIVHRHRQLWSDPDAFDPDRFAPGADGGRPRLAYLPFATGPRVCVGASFAITQMLIVTAALARRFRFRLTSDAPVTPVGRVSLQPQGGLPMTIERRERASTARRGGALRPSPVLV